MTEHVPDASPDPQRDAIEKARLPLTVGLTVTGATIALGYLSSLVQGPVIAVFGGVALMTFGRALGREHREGALLCAAMVILAGSWSVAAMRWSSLALDDLRGAQGVLGQTLLVGSGEVVTGGWLAAAAGVLALVVWAASPPTEGRGAWVRGAEALPAAGATATVFWGSGIAGRSMGDLGTALLVVVGIGLTAVAGSAFGPGTGARWRALAVAVLALLAGSVFVARGL